MYLFFNSSGELKALWVSGECKRVFLYMHLRLFVFNWEEKVWKGGQQMWNNRTIPTKVGNLWLRSAQSQLSYCSGQIINNPTRGGKKSLSSQGLDTLSQIFELVYLHCKRKKGRLLVLLFDFAISFNLFSKVTLSAFN